MFEHLYKNAAAQPREGDYVFHKGLLYCGQCNQARECLIEYPAGSGTLIKKPILCQCEIQTEDKHLKRKMNEESDARVNHLRRQGVTDEAYSLQRFETDDHRNPRITRLCMRYVEKWEQMKEKSFGITFTGAVGGGKSFYACCIANALIDKGVSVLVTRLSDLVRNRIQDKTPIINLRKFELIVLDDIGVEGTTQTAYNIVDDIYRAYIPLIVTTNLSISQLEVSNPIEKKRIYDRILQRACIPIKVDVTISRLDIARKNAQDAYNILNEEI